MFTATGWRYYWRRYLGWFPVQFCVVCGGWYWGGLPRLFVWKDYRRKTQVVVWMPWIKEYCSEACCNEDMDAADRFSLEAGPCDLCEDD